jgi:methylmalonyl-CoA mutase
MGASELKKGLFSEFPPVSTEEWESVIENDLKGADYEKKLVWRSVDGITVKPYYRREDLKDLDVRDSNPGQYPYTRGSKSNVNNWFIRQEVPFTSVERSAAKALSLISKGTESIHFTFQGQISPDELKELLLKLPLDQIEVKVTGLDISILPRLLDNLSTGNGIISREFRLNWDWDPIGDLCLSGKLFDEASTYEQMADILRVSKDFSKLRVIGVHGTYFRRAGSKFVQELAFSLAQANEYLAEMDELGIPADETAPKIAFNFAIGSNYFLEMAKLRAARMLWSRIVESYKIQDPDQAKMYVHAETSMWNKTVYDPYVNMLRTTTEAMSAILGGVNSLTVHPFDSTYREPDEFSERLARNKQIILKEEAHFDKVVDPGGGSYYIEKLTDSIAREAWKLFQEVERQGGFTEAFLSGYIQNEIVTSAQLRDENIARRREILLGINQYPDFNEVLNSKADPSVIKTPVADPSGADAHPLIPYRGAEGFESIRMATEESGKRPKVFMLPIGNKAWRKARADFSANFFGCAGYEIIGNRGFESVIEGVEAAVSSKAAIVVLCSSDDEYKVYGPEFARSVTGGFIPVIAGYPEDQVESLKKDGIKYLIHVRSNILETLKEFNEKLGIEV